MSFQRVPVSWRDVAEMLRLLAQAINALADGRSNATGSVTLTASTTTTQVADARVGIDSVITLMPTTSNAAGALATTYVGTVTSESFTLTHANNAQVDRTFKYAIQG